MTSFHLYSRSAWNMLLKGIQCYILTIRAQKLEKSKLTKNSSNKTVAVQLWKLVFSWNCTANRKFYAAATLISFAFVIKRSLTFALGVKLVCIDVTLWHLQMLFLYWDGKVKQMTKRRHRKKLYLKRLCHRTDNRFSKPLVF